MIKYSAIGEKELFEANLKLPKHISRGIRRGAYISGKELVADLRADMGKSKSGRTYRVYKGVSGGLKRGRLHTASAPSETPAVITGEFRKSIDFEVRGNKRLEFGSGKDGLASYAKYLEEGTSRMKARMPIQRTAKKLDKRVLSNLTTEVNKEIRKAGFNLNNI